MAVKNGIDISEHQGNIDWKSVKTDFCIIRAGYGRVATQKDKYFEANYNGCKSRGIPCGIYWYSYAKTPAEAEIEADVCLQIIKGKQFEYPIYFDVEEQSLFATGKANTSAVIRAFLKKVEAAGYFVGLYMSASPLNAYVEDDIKSKYVIWVAHYGVSRPSYGGSYGVWQYGSTGKVSGIAGNVDTNYGYTDYATIIKNAGLNGFPKPTQTTETKPVTPAVEVVQSATGTLTLEGVIKIGDKKYPIKITNLEIKPE